MSLSSKFKRFQILGLIGFLAFSLLPFKVLAASNSTFNTSFDNGLFSIVPADQAAVLRADGCSADMGAGFVFSMIGAVQIPIGGSNLTNRLCALNQLEETGSVNIEKLKGNVNVLDTLGSVNNFIINQRPLSTVDYVQDKVYALTGRVNAADPVPYFAGGTGYQLLEPIQAFWGWSVNVVYAFLILIIIGIAFAIVFRQKIGGKEMVTIQSAIPSIAMAMILVPLSYAISGLFIDFIGIGANTVHAFFFAPGAPARSVYEGRDLNTCDNNLVVTNATGSTTSSGTTDDPCDRGLYIDDSRFEWYNFNSIIDVTDEIEGVANTTTQGQGMLGGQGVNSFFITVLIGNLLNLLSGTGNSPAYWFGEIINAILLILMIWVSARIAWRLLKKYLTLILTPIVSPFIFASVAVPGNGMSTITNFAKSMGSASLHFIVTYALFVVTLVFTSNVFADQLPAFSRGIFIPPILGLKSVFESMPVSGSESLTSFMFGVMGIGVFFSIPSILDNIDKSLGVKEANLGFIKAPLDALKDSYVGMRYTAPAFAARTGIATGRLARNSAFALGRTTAAIEDLGDRLRGRDPGVDADTARYRRRQRLATSRQRAEEDYYRAKQAGNIGGMALAQARMAGANAMGEYAGSGVGYPGEADKAPKIEVVGNEYTIPVSQIRNLLAAAGCTIVGNTVTRPAPAALREVLLGNVKLTIEAKGDARLFAPINIYLGTAVEDRGVFVYNTNVLPGDAELIGAVNNEWTTTFAPPVRTVNSPVINPGRPIPAVNNPIGAFFAGPNFMEYSDSSGVVQRTNAMQLRIGAGRNIDREAVYNNKFDLNVSIIGVDVFTLLAGPGVGSFEIAANGAPLLVNDQAQLSINRNLQTDRRAIRVENPARGLTTTGFRITIKLG